MEISEVYDLTFKSDEKVFDGESENYFFKVVEVAKLNLPTGKLVACDPFTFEHGGAYTTELPQGEFPVIVSEYWDENKTRSRIAMSKLAFSDAEPVRWVMATVEGQDLDKLSPGEFFGYGVDSGTGCFVDESVASKISEYRTSGNSRQFLDTLSGAFDKVETEDTDGYVSVDNGFGGNLVAFRSGFGDGLYGTYYGYGEDGNICCALTRFV